MQPEIADILITILFARRGLHRRTKISGSNSTLWRLFDAFAAGWRNLAKAGMEIAMQPPKVTS